MALSNSSHTNFRFVCLLLLYKPHFYYKNFRIMNNDEIFLPIFTMCNNFLWQKLTKIEINNWSLCFVNNFCECSSYATTVFPDLTRERYARNDNSSTYVRMVARAAYCVCCSQWFWVFSGLKAPCQREKTRENWEIHCKQQTHYAARATILTYVLLLALCA